MRRVRAAVLVALACLLCIPGGLGGEPDRGPLEELVGTWELPGDPAKGVRKIEFLFDGTVIDSLVTGGKDAEMTVQRRRMWSVEMDRIVVRGGSSAPGVALPRLEITLPFRADAMEIVEITEAADTTTSRRMVAKRADETESAEPGETLASLDRLLIEVVPSRRETPGTQRTQKLGLTFNIRNPDLSHPTGPFRIDYFIIGKDEGQANVFNMLVRGSFEGQLGATFADREMTYRSDIRQIIYTPKAIGSFAYEGWAFILADPKRGVRVSRATRPEWERAPDKLSAIKERAIFNNDLSTISP